VADDNPISAARTAAPDLAAHARALVDAAPPLTSRQRDRLAAPADRTQAAVAAPATMREGGMS
jgi:hypothetical protein